MSYMLDWSLSLGTGKAGLSDLRAQLVDTSGGAVGAAVSTGFTEIGSGCYLWHVTAIPDGHRGGVKFFSAASPAAVLAFGAINPEEAESVTALRNLLMSGVVASVNLSATQAEQIAEGMIALAAYADFAQSITATTADNLATAEAFWFCVKARATDADADAVLLLSAADGLVTLAGATYATPANGTLTVFGTAGAWTVAATLTAQATALLTDYAGRHLVAEIKYRLASDAVRVLWSGVAAISRSVIHRTA